MVVKTITTLAGWLAGWQRSSALREVNCCLLVIRFSCRGIVFTVTANRLVRNFMGACVDTQTHSTVHCLL
uniref:Putative secreted protein n=1 Tax=Anopheles darlingi TaxID=43151 RepID=A0A2M4DC03_ANODA